MTDKNRTKVEIYGQQYTIIGTDPASHIHLVASLVDKKMHEMRSMNASLDTNNLAVLTAVNAVHDYLILKEQFELLEKQLQHLKE
ncbi:cell division protein ZapA [Heyndrickxia sp. NPDC080065]|uniref:cell division protein ZapA n=1 Tax=Heyndrickxia sp. NPDC080065 TaxID=3390568 RepID=UPI003CFFA2C2